MQKTQLPLSSTLGAIPDIWTRSLESSRSLSRARLAGKQISSTAAAYETSHAPQNPTREDRPIIIPERTFDPRFFVRADLISMAKRWCNNIVHMEHNPCHDACASELWCWSSLDQVRGRDWKTMLIEEAPIFYLDKLPQRLSSGDAITRTKAQYPRLFIKWVVLYLQ